MQFHLDQACFQCPVYAPTSAELLTDLVQQVSPVTALYRPSADVVDTLLHGAGLVLKTSRNIQNLLLPGDAICYLQGQHREYREIGVIEDLIWPGADPQQCRPQQLKLCVVPVARGEPAEPHNWNLKKTRGHQSIELDFSSIICPACIISLSDYDSVIPGAIDHASLSTVCIFEEGSASSQQDQLAAHLRCKLPPAWRRLEIIDQCAASARSAQPLLCR